MSNYPNSRYQGLSQIQVLQQKYKKSVWQTSVMVQTNNQLKQELDHKNKTLQQIIQHNNNLERLVQTQKQEKGSILNNLQNIQEQNHQINREMMEEQKKNQQWGKKYQKILQENEKLKQQQQHKQTHENQRELKQNKDRLKSVLDQNTKLQEQIKVIKNKELIERKNALKMEEQISSWKKKMANEQNKAELQREINEVKKINTSLKTDINKLHDEKKVLISTIQRQQEQLFEKNKVENNSSKLLLILHELQKQVQPMKQQLIDLKQKHNKLRNRPHRVDWSSEQVDEDIKMIRMEQQCSNLRLMNENLKMKLSNQKKDYQSVMNDEKLIRELRQDKEILESRVIVLQAMNITEKNRDYNEGNNNRMRQFQRRVELLLQDQNLTIESNESKESRNIHQMVMLKAYITELDQKLEEVYRENQSIMRRYKYYKHKLKNRNKQKSRQSEVNGSLNLYRQKIASYDQLIMKICQQLEIALQKNEAQNPEKLQHYYKQQITMMKITIGKQKQKAIKKENSFRKQFNEMKLKYQDKIKQIAQLQLNQSHQQSSTIKDTGKDIEYRAYSKQNIQKDKTIIRLEQQLQVMRGQFHKEKENLLEAHQTSMERLNAQIANLKRQKTEYVIKHNQVENRNGELENLLIVQNGKIRDLENMQHKNIEIANECHRLEQTNVKLEREVYQLNEQIRNLQENIKKERNRNIISQSRLKGNYEVQGRRQEIKFVENNQVMENYQIRINNQIRTLKEQISTLIEEKNQLLGQKITQKIEKETIISERNNLSQEIIPKLRIEKDQTIKKKTALQKQIQELIKQNKQLKTRINTLVQAKERNIKLNSKIVHLTQKLQNVEDTQHNVITELEPIKQDEIIDNGKVENRLKQAQKAIDHWNSSYNKKLQQLEHAEEWIRKLEDENDELKRTLMNIQNEHSADARVEQLDQQIIKLNTEFKNYRNLKQQQFLQYQSHISNANQSIQQLQVQLDLYNTQCSKLREQVTSLQLGQSDNQAIKQYRSHESSNEIKFNEQRMNKIKQQYQKEINNVNQQNVILRTSILTIKNQKEEIETINNQLKHQIHSLKLVLESDGKNMEIVELRNQINQLKNKLSLIENQQRNYQDRERQLLAQLHSTHRNTANEEQLRKNINQLQLQIERQQEEFKNKHQVKQAVGEIHGLKNRNQQSLSILFVSFVEIESLRIRLNQLHEQIHQMEQEYHQKLKQQQLFASYSSIANVELIQEIECAHKHLINDEVLVQSKVVTVTKMPQNAL